MDPADMPPRIRALPRDPRGYPIPYVVMEDAAGAPHFAVNDGHKVMEAAARGRCGICGQPLGAFKCFVGGPASALHPKGRFFDGPMHLDCGEYAMRTCPYLALAGRYKRRIGGLKLAQAPKPAGYVGVHDPTVHAPQPAVFVLASTKRFEIGPRGHYIPERPWRRLSYWRGGAEIGEAEAKELARNDPTAAVAFEELVWS